MIRIFQPEQVAVEPVAYVKNIKDTTESTM